jgi:hypothetical protein
MKKMQAGGVAGKSPKSPDKKGAFITVQKRNLPKAKTGGKCLGCGGKMKGR